MILVVANRFDLAARQVARDWRERGVRLLTCEDLSTAGWHFHVGGGRRAARFVAGGVAFPETEISAVLTRMTGVWEPELVHIAAGDRGYVASEMSAFLLAWLTALDCPVLNRPVPGSLCGPCWRPEQWVAAAVRAGISVRPVHRRLRLGEASPSAAVSDGPAAVTVIGERCLGEVHASLAGQARRLADVARVDLLRVFFSGPEEGAWFTGADPLPAIGPDEMAAVFAYFSTPGRWSLPPRPPTC